MKNNLTEFVKSIDELDSVIALISRESGGADSCLNKPDLVAVITGKTQAVRKHIAELDARIEKTIADWEDLKKNEIGLTVLESQIRKFLHTADAHGG
jgi:hypothetical protein